MLGIQQGFQQLVAEAQRLMAAVRLVVELSDFQCLVVGLPVVRGGAQRLIAGVQLLMAVFQQP